MGTKMATTYATLVTGYIEENLYKKYEETLGTNEPEEFIKIFKRFLDDCFLFWERPFKELHKFHNITTNHQSAWKNGLNNGKIRIKKTFLDVLVYKEAQKLHTDIFYKKTDTHANISILIPAIQNNA